MPVALGFEEPATFAVKASGDVTIVEIERLFQDIERDARLRQRPDVLVDARGVRDAPTTSELRIIAVDMGRLVQRGLGPIAVVTDSVFMYGIVRMFSFFAEAVCATVHPFHDVDDARRWLRKQPVKRTHASRGA